MWVQLLGWGKISKAFTKKLIKLRNLWRVESKSLVARGTEIFAKEEKKTKLSRVPINGKRRNSYFGND